MGKIRVIQLSEEQRAELEAGYEKGTSHAFRKRCQTILLKSERRSSSEVAGIVKMHPVSVNTWADRYEAEGIDGLLTKAGRGRKPLLNKEKDAAAVIEAVKANRQSLKAAKAAFEQGRSSGNRVVSGETLRRFLKVLTADIKE